ncbi:unnamed protein product [Durusdinium trenchii]|uniref:E3 ubiquitin-protein ligase HERC2 n=1 Tax=Durusdinium trenchii TaxID=1381693 RepID=A0ABP0KAQ2_9DINO
MSAPVAQNNFFLWGTWKARKISKPFLTKKVPSTLKKVVLGESCVLGLTETGKVVSWGKDSKTGCLGLGEENGIPIVSSDAPQEVPKLKDVMDIQMGPEHVVALTSSGEVYTWGSGSKGQLGSGRCETLHAPSKVEALSNEQIVQILVVKSSTFALSSNGTVFAWGDNQDNALGLEDGKLMEESPRKLTLLQETRVRKLEVFDGKTIIAHIRGNDSDTNFGRYETLPEDGGHGEKEEMEIFQGIDEMRKIMEKTQEWWNHLLNIKHGQPYELPQDSNVNLTDSPTKVGANIQDDLEVEVERLHRAERHLDALVTAAVQELRRTQQMPGTRNVRFILCMFIDECRLRREKVQRTIAARRIQDARRKDDEKAASDPIFAYSVKDFSSSANEHIRKIIAVTKELQQRRDAVSSIVSVDVLSELLKGTLIKCLDCKLQLHETQIELLKVSEGKLCDPMLPALRIIKDRWDSLKHFSLYALYLECEQKKIDQMLQIDKDDIISHDTMVPGLCYDLLRENAELRKMTNSYQLHVLMLYQGKDITDASGISLADLKEKKLAILATEFVVEVVGAGIRVLDTLRVETVPEFPAAPLFPWDAFRGTGGLRGVFPRRGGLRAA